MHSPDSHLPSPSLKGDYKVALVSTYWNQDLCDKMVADAKSVLDSENSILAAHYQVAGCLELGQAARRLTRHYDAIILFGVVIRGETAHFDYVCQGITTAHAEINIRQDIPVIFGVLTVDNKRQAIERIEGPVEQKGADCAKSAMLQLALAEKLLSKKRDS